MNFKIICFATLFVAIQLWLVQILCRSIRFVRILWTVNFWFGTPHYMYAIPISAISINATFFWAQHLALIEGLLYKVCRKTDKRVLCCTRSEREEETSLWVLLDSSRMNIFRGNEYSGKRDLAVLSTAHPPRLKNEGLVYQITIWHLIAMEIDT